MKSFHLAFFAFCMSVFGFSVDSRAHDQVNLERNEERIYVSPTELVISNDGLFLIDSNELIPLLVIGLDEFGFYIEAKAKPEIRPKKNPTCVNGHPIYHKECGGCAHWWCNSRCKCHSPWQIDNS